MKRDTLKSFKWSFFTAILRKIILFAVFLLVAKEITKEDLGIFREFSLVLGIFTSISFLGFKDLLIVKKEKTKSLFQQLFQFSLIVSLLTYFILVFIAPQIGKYYKSQILTDLIVTLSPLIILEILRIALRAYYQKTLRFKVLSIIETINVVVYSLLIILFLYIRLDIYTLILIFYFGNLVEFILLIALEYDLVKKTLKKIFSLNLLKDFFTSYRANKKFLLTATSNNVISMLINDLPVIILGILFNPIVIGIYYLANQLIGQPVVLACNSLGQVLFPTFTFMKKEELKERIDKFFSIVTLYAFPLFFILVIYVLNLVPLILGSKWNEALPIVSILAFSLATTLLVNPISSLPYVLELPQVEIVYMIINLSLKSLAIYLGHFSGFETALLYYVITTVFIHFAFISLVTHLLRGNILKTLFAIVLRIIPSLVFIIVYALLASYGPLIQLPLVTLMVVVYLLVIFRQNRAKSLL